MIKMIWCEDLNHGIGKNNKMPWFIKKEMQHFRKETLNKIVVMGRKTLESLNNNNGLKNRTNIVLTKNKDLVLNQGLKKVTDINEVLTLAKNNEVYIIGGKQIYELFLPYANELIVSKLSKDYNCDTKMNITYNDFILAKIEKHSEFNVEYYVRKK